MLLLMKDTRSDPRTPQIERRTASERCSEEKDYLRSSLLAEAAAERQAALLRMRVELEAAAEASRAAALRELRQRLEASAADERARALAAQKAALEEAAARAQARKPPPEVGREMTSRARAAHWNQMCPCASPSRESIGVGTAFGCLASRFRPAFSEIHPPRTDSRPANRRPRPWQRSAFASRQRPRRLPQRSECASPAPCRCAAQLLRASPSAACPSHSFPPPPALPASGGDRAP